MMITQYSLFISTLILTFSLSAAQAQTETAPEAPNSSSTEAVMVARNRSELNIQCDKKDESQAECDELKILYFKKGKGVNEAPLFKTYVFSKGEFERKIAILKATLKEAGKPFRASKNFYSQDPSVLGEEVHNGATPNHKLWWIGPAMILPICYHLVDLLFLTPIHTTQAAVQLLHTESGIKLIANAEGTSDLKLLNQKQFNRLVKLLDLLEAQ